MTETAQFRVPDFDCPACAGTVERSLRQADGVENVDVHYATGRVAIEYDESTADPGDFERTIERRGYTPRPA